MSSTRMGSARHAADISSVGLIDVSLSSLVGEKQGCKRVGSTVSWRRQGWKRVLSVSHCHMISFLGARAVHK